MDKLVTGPFGSNACYEQTFTQDGKEVTTWMCMGSGFTSSTLMTKDSAIVQNTLETAPDLYKDLMHVDDKGLVWFPATITLPEKGMVFVDGTGKEDWKWCAVHFIKNDQQSKLMAKQKTKPDMENAKYFAQRDFMDACEEIGFFNE